MTNNIQIKKKEEGLTLRYLDTHTEVKSIYVLNNTALVSKNGVARRKPGILNIGIVHDNGQVTSVTIPETWIPIDVTEQCQKEELLKSSVFRSQINNGVLKLISEEEAQEIFDNDPDAIEELERLQFERTREPTVVELDEEEEEVTLRTDEKDLHGINPIIFEALEREDISDADMINTIKTNRFNINQKDIQYIIAHTNSEKVKRVASELLKK